MDHKILALFFVLLSITTQAKLDLSFSKTRGYFNSSFSLIIEADDPNAIIRYTTNSRTPTFNVGSTYNGPININKTRVVKAFAYSSTDTTKIEAHSYIFMNTVLNQPDNTTGFPYATGFSTSIKNDGTYGALLDDALLAIPIMSLSLFLNDYGFIYNNKGISKQAYIEYFDPNNTGESYGRPTGASTYGNTSFNAETANKKNYRLRFKEEFGASKYKHKIFGDEATDEFDVLDLRCGSQESFDRGGVQNIHEQIMKNWQIQTSGYGVHGKFVHLFINGIYWGVYTVCERPENSFGESYFGGAKEEYNTVKATCCDTEALAIDGTITSYNYMKTQTNNYPAIEQYLDIDHFIDYVMICNYGPHGDWRTWNTYAIDNPAANVPYRFFVWDPEPSFKNDWYYTDNIVDTRDHEDIWQPLKTHADFRMRFADHVECNCMQADGALNPNKATAYYDAIFQQNKLAYLAEAARWANKNLYNNFLNYRNDIVNTNWFFDRSQSLINSYKSNNLYPDLDAVTFSQYGGIINNGTNLTLNNPNGTGSIRYTIDRSDPRAAGGGLSATAQTYNEPISLPSGVYEVKARIKKNNDWSAMCPRKFYVDQNYSGLVINEIHYNPEDSIFFNPSINAIDTVSGRNFEFIELKNTGNQAVYLEDVHFNKGITFRFEQNSIILPGSFVVIAEDAFWFEQKYGFPPEGTFSGKLENSGESIWLLDPFDHIIDTLKYDDTLPWDTIPDRGKYSLALIDANLDNTNATNWSAQAIYTSPNAANVFCDGSLTFNEVIIPASCNSLNDGFINGNASGGQAPYTYQWNTGANTNTISNLNAGTYTLIVTDAVNCQYEASYQITEPAALSATVQSTNQSYYQTDDGTAMATASGGNAPYTYSWSNGANTASVNNLAPGNYTVTITDAFACSITKNTTVQAIDCSTLNVSVNKTDQSYYQTNNGMAEINVSGGTAPYAYTWSNGSTIASIANLAPNSYFVNILDALGCSLSYSIVIEAVLCNQLQVDVRIEHESCYGANDGLLQITSIEHGTTPYSILWSTGITGTVSNNLSGGTYQLAVTDKQGCPFNNSYTINAATELSANTTVEIASSDQARDGAIDLTVIGGIAPYSYYWSNAATSQHVNGLLPGTYWVSVLDANNCQILINNIKVGNNCPSSIIQQNQPALTTATFQVSDFIQSNGRIDLNEHVNFKAGDYIELSNDFEIIQGAQFEAVIEGCE